MRSTGIRRKHPRAVVVFFSVLLTCVALAGAAAAYAVNYFNPDYTWYTKNPDASVFEISTAGQLQAFSDLVDGYAYYNDALQPAVSFEGKTVRLTGNIALLGSYGYEFYSIGTTDHPFSGTFDGNGKTISGLKITEKTASSYVGLFGYCDASSCIKNLTLEDNSTVSVAVSDTHTVVRYVGSLVGYTQGTVSGCISRAAVYVSWDDGNGGDTRTADNTVVVSGVGGVAGVCDGDIQGTSFTGSLAITTPANSYFDVSEQTNTAIIVTYVGGITGRSGGSVELSRTGIHTGNLSNCSNAAAITITTSGAGGVDRFGEVVDSKSQYVGGIAGYAIGNVSSCTNTGDILATSYISTGNATTDEAGYEAAAGGGQCTGGIVGSLRGEKTSGYAGVGTVGSDAGIDAQGADPLVLSDCQNLGSVISLVDVGGIAGSAGTYTTITRCANGDAAQVRKDDTVARIEGTRWNKPCIGGIVGETFGEVSYSRNHGEVTTTNIGYYIGGIVGNVYYYNDYSGQKAQPNPEVFACYNTGQVSCTASLRRGAIVGGNGGYIHDCLYLYGTANLADDVNIAAIGENDGTYARLQVAYANDAQATLYSGISLKSKAAVSFLNGLAPLDGWSHYYITNATLNSGYPILNTEGTSSGSVDLASLNPEVTLTQNASYTAAYNPIPTVQISVTLNGSRVTLTQGSDYVVTGDAHALGTNGICTGVTATGETPYTCTIEGIGDYSGVLSGCAYGISRGTFSECSVLVDAASYTGTAQNNPTVTVTDASGGVVSPTDYTCVVNNGADCIEPSYEQNIYYAVVTAKDSSNYYGSAQGIYTINKVDVAKECDTVGIIYGSRVWYYDEDKYQLYEVIPVLDAKGNLTYHSDTGFPVVEGEIGYVGDNGITLTKATPKYTDATGKTIYGMSVDYTASTIDPAVIGVIWNGHTLDTSWYHCVYGGGSGGGTTSAGNNQAVEGLSNIEASTTGAITVAYTGTYTENYIVMNFDIVQVNATPRDFTVDQNFSYYAYNEGKAPSVPLDVADITTTPIKLIYEGNVVDTDNYELVPDYSVDNVTGDVHTGTDITYNAGDTVYYTVHFIKDTSIICADIDDAVSFTIISDQLKFDSTTVEIEVDDSGCIYNPDGCPAPIIRVKNKSTGEYLTEGKDYYYYLSGDVAAGTHTFAVQGIGLYAGKIKGCAYTIQEGTLTSDMFDSTSPSYVSNIKLANCQGSYFDKSGLCFAYRVSGYTADDLEDMLRVAWVENDEGLGSGSNVTLENGKLFTISNIRDSAGNVIDKIQTTGTYTVHLSHNPHANAVNYAGKEIFDTSEDFSLDCQITVNKANLSDSGAYTDSVTGKTYSYVQTGKLKFPSTAYSYTGNPVVPKYQIYDSWTYSNQTASDAELAEHLFSSDEYDVYVAGYGTTGPTEVNDLVTSPYVVEKIAAKAESTQICGERAMSASSSPSTSYTFAVTAADISDSDVVTIKVDDAIYTGDALTPAVHFYIGGQECNYVLGEDYALTYTNNVVGARATDESAPTVTITILNKKHLVAFDSDENEVDLVSVTFDIGYAPITLASANWTWGKTVSLTEGATDATLETPVLFATYTATDGTHTVRTLPADAYTAQTGTFDGITFTPKTSGWASGESVYYDVTSNATNPAFVGSTLLGPTTVVAVTSANSFSQIGQSGNSLSATLDSTSYTYTAAQITPVVTVKDNDVTLTEGIDYTLSFGDNLNVSNTGRVTILGMGAYTGSTALSFTITAANLSECILSVSPQTYTGSQITPDANALTVTLGGNTLQASDWQLDTAAYGSNTESAPSGGSLTITAGGSGNVTGTKAAVFSISALALSTERFSVETVSKTYDKTAQTLSAADIKVTDTITGCRLTYGDDYTLNYSGDHISAGDAVIWITGKGNYTASISATFTIAPIDLSSAELTLTRDTYTYTGTTIKPDVTVKLGDEILTEKYTATTGEICGDYGVNFSNNVTPASLDAPEAPTLTVVGRGNYTGSAHISFSIVPAALTDTTATITLPVTTYTYTGTAITPVPTTVKLGDFTLAASDYTLSYADNNAIGTATVTVTGTGSTVTGSISNTFTIVQASLSKATIAAIPNQAYAFGSAVTPVLSVTGPSGETLTCDKDYTLTYANNTSLGSAMATITGMGAYTGSLSATFKITRIPLALADVSMSPSSFIYDGKEHTPTVAITVGGKTLALGTDYTLSYLGDKKSAGSQVIEVNTPDTSVYSSSLTLSYAINELTSITSATVSAIPKQVYTGSALTPEPIVTLDGRTLVKGSDYTLAYANNTSSGTARVTATGTGLYTGSVTSIFTIVSFPDIDTGAWYVTDGWLSYVIGHGLMTGYSDTGNFEPYGNITRGQVATILYRYACSLDSTLISTYGSTTDASKYASKTVFTDEGAGTYYTAAINWAYAVGIMTGDSSTGYTTVRPDDSVTREDLCLMIYRYVKSVDPTLALHTGSVDYSSVIGIDTVDFWATDAVKWCASWGIIGGVNEGGSYHMNPIDTAWRASMAKMITVTLRDVMAG